MTDASAAAVITSAFTSTASREILRLLLRLPLAVAAAVVITGGALSAGVIEVSGGRPRAVWYAK